MKYNFKKLLVWVFAVVLCVSGSGRNTELAELQELREEGLNETVKVFFKENEKAKSANEDLVNEAKKAEYSQFVSFEDGQIDLSDDFKGPLDVKKEDPKYYQCDDSTIIDTLSDEEKKEQLRIDFIKENAALMNEMVEQGFGYVSEDGNFIVVDSEYQQQDTWVYDYSWSIWSNMQFKTNSWLSGIFAVAGLAMSFKTIFGDVKSLANNTKANPSLIKGKFSDLFNNNYAVKNAAFDASNEIIGDVNMADAISRTVTFVMAVLSVLVTIMTATGIVGLVVGVVMTIASLYLPGLLTGMDLLFNGCVKNKGASVNIGWWWSNYNVL
jgi:hypothetical protein